MADEETKELNAIDVYTNNFNVSSYWFIIVTIIFFIIKIINIPSTLLDKYDKNNLAYENFTDKISTILYIFLVIMEMVYFNTEIIRAKCGPGANTSYLVFLTTFFPWLSIFGMLYVLLTLFNGWKAPFSNTFGYIITMNFLGGKSKIKQLLASKDEKKGDDFNRTQSIIKDNIANVINDFAPDNIGALHELSEINKLFKPYSTTGQTDEQNKRTKKIYNEFAKLVIAKDYISEFIWFILTGIIIINISTNYILEQNCI